MRRYTDSEIISRVERLPSFAGWKTGLYLICIRSRSDEYDRFDDKAYVYTVLQHGHKPAFMLQLGVTTNTGAFGLTHFRNWNPEGVAVLKSDQIVYDSHKRGLHKGKPAYVQEKSFPYYRDGNRNHKAEEIGSIHTGVIGANVHRSGEHSSRIGSWSTACIVADTLYLFIAFLAISDGLNRPPLTLAILKEF